MVGACRSPSVAALWMTWHSRVLSCVLSPYAAHTAGTGDGAGKDACCRSGKTQIWQNSLATTPPFLWMSCLGQTLSLVWVSLDRSQKILLSALAMDQYPIATYPGYFCPTICAFDTKWPQAFLPTFEPCRTKSKNWAVLGFMQKGRAVTCCLLGTSVTSTEELRNYVEGWEYSMIKQQFKKTYNFSGFFL